MPLYNKGKNMSKKRENSKYRRILSCSFCGKAQHEVKKLIAGPSVFICSECVELCLSIVHDNEHSKKAFEIKLLRGEVKLEELGVSPLFYERRFQKKINQCFVLCPFSEPFDTVYTDHIAPAIQQKQLSALRADDIYGVEPIMEDIWRGINESSFIVAEVTGRNANVMYEVGIAHTIGKPVILLTQEVNDVPFDLRHYRFIRYDYTPRGCKDLEEKISKTIDAISYVWRAEEDHISSKRFGEVIETRPPVDTDKDC